MIETTPNIVLVVTVAMLTAVGVYLILERSLTRVLLGIILVSNAVNLLFMIASGVPGRAPIIGQNDEADMSDPLPQAMVLTAIVITLGMTAFLLAMAYRSWQLNAHDEVQDDLEDRRIARRAAADLAAYQDADADVTTTLDEDAAEVRDETGDTVRPPARPGEAGPEQDSERVESAEGGDVR